MGEDLVARMVLVLNEVVEHGWMESKTNELLIIIVRLLIIENVYWQGWPHLYCY